MIPRDVYDELLSGWYDERHIKPIIEQIHFLVKQRLD